MLGLLRGSSERIGCVAFSPDGRTLAGGSNVLARSGVVRLWDVATRQERLVLRDLKTQPWTLFTTRMKPAGLP